MGGRMLAFSFPFSTDDIFAWLDQLVSFDLGWNGMGQDRMEMEL